MYIMFRINPDCDHRHHNIFIPLAHLYQYNYNQDCPAPRAEHVDNYSNNIFSTHLVNDLHPYLYNQDCTAPRAQHVDNNNIFHPFKFKIRIALRRVPSMLRQDSRVQLRRHSLVASSR